jgi:hypothetical protein
MFRDQKPSLPRKKLEHAEASLLTCGFIAGRKVIEEEIYSVDYLKFDSCGWPLQSDSFRRHAGGRLLEYVETGREKHSWAERSWIFAVPLEAIDNPQAFQTEISDPFWNILSNGPELAFSTNSSACIFANE